MILMKNGQPVPEPLLTALEEDEEVKVIFMNMRPSCQKQYVGHIIEAKKEETRMRRLSVVLEQIRNSRGERDVVDGLVNSDAIEQYIEEQSEEVRPILRKIRETIRTAAPDATEKIAWRMPTFWQGENLIHFAAFKNHIGIYPGGEATTAFADRLTGYKTSKGTVQLPLNKPIPYDLIADITRWRVAAVQRDDT